METELEITWRGISPSDAIEADVRERIAKLERFHHTLIGCRVVIETPHHHHQKGNLFHVVVDLKVPGAEIAVGRDSGARHQHEDPYVAVRDAFDALRRRLEDHARKRRGDVKLHEPPAVGRIARIFHDDGYGFLSTVDGREIYFNASSVLGGNFARLAPGTEVRFAEEAGEDGPQASSVHLVGKHHPLG